MKISILRFILPILLLLFAGATFVGASSSGHGSAEKATAQAEAASVSTHEAPATHIDEGHGAPADAHGTADAHGKDVHGAVADTHAVTTEGHGEGAHGEVHGGSLAPAKLKDLLWRTLNFIALVIILVKFLAKPIASGLSGRQKQIQEEMQDLLAQRDEAEIEYKEFESRLAGMEQEMERVVEQAIAQAENEKQRILREAEEAAEDIKHQAEASIQAELEDAKRVLRDEVAEQAAVMAEELIVKNLTQADQETITEQFLEKVGAVQ